MDTKVSDKCAASLNRVESYSSVFKKTLLYVHLFGRFIDCLHKSISPFWPQYRNVMLYSKGGNLIKNICAIQVWLLFGVTVTTWGHCNPCIIHCYQRQFRIESWRNAEAYLQTNTFVLQLECKYWRTKPFCSVCMIKRAITKVCCMSCKWSQLYISHFPDGSIVQIFSADFVTSFMDPFLKNFKVIFCKYFRPCFSAAWIILFFYNFHSHFPYFDALVFVTQVLHVRCLQTMATYASCFV